MDIGIPVFQSFIGVLFVVLGLVIGLSKDPRKRKLLVSIASCVLGLATVGATWVQSSRSQASRKADKDESSRELQKTVSAEVGKATAACESRYGKLSQSVQDGRNAAFAGIAFANPSKAKKIQQFAMRLNLATDLNYEPNENARDATKIVTTISTHQTDQWKVSDEQLAPLAAWMKPYASMDRRKDFIMAIRWDRKAASFAAHLAWAFREAGWNMGDPGFSLSNRHVAGVVMRLHSEQSDPPGFREVVTLLRRIGIEPMGETDKHIPNDRFQILIGSKD